MKQETINISICPEIIHSFEGTLTFGDIHGNALKLLHILIKFDYIEVSSEQYLKFYALYKKDIKKINKQDIEDLEEIINFKINEKKIRLIGDILCDRGTSDWLTLKVLNPLNCEVLLSNHDLGFIKTIEHVIYTKELANIGNISPCFSLDNMIHLASDDLISMDEVVAMYSNYKNKLKLISYKDLGAKLRIYSHAPASLESLLEVFNSLGIDEGSGKEFLINSIDKVNSIVLEYAKQDKLTELFTNKVIYNFVWNIECSQMSSVKDGVEFEFVHGHIGEKENKYEHYINLDTDLGKAVFLDKGKLIYID